MEARKIASVNPTKYQQTNENKEVFCGITTRKRAALKAVNNVTCNGNLKKMPLLNFKPSNKLSDKENGGIGLRESNETKTDIDSAFNDLQRQPFIWPNCSEINKNECIRNLFKTLSDRKEIIRRYYTNKIVSETPIWYPTVSNDEYMHTEYLPFIIDHLMESEQFYEPLGCNFLDSSIDINYRHRYSLIDYMVQIHERLAMSNECLQLSITIMDRFIKSLKAQLKRDDVSIIGVMCLYIAGKVEEVYMHTLNEFLEEINCGYDVVKCRLLEGRIMSTIDFKLSIPLPLSFIRHYNLMFKADSISHFYSRYFCELSLHDYLASGYSSNMIGASCVFLAQVICQKKVTDFGTVWSPTLQCSSGLLYTDFIHLVKNLCVIVSKQQTPSKYRAIAIKYSNEHYMEVAKTTIQSVGFKNILEHFKASLR